MRWPLIPLRDEVRYVAEFGPLFVGRPWSKEAAQRALWSDRVVLLVAQRHDEPQPQPADLYSVGVRCDLIDCREVEQGALRLMLDPRERVRISAPAFEQSFSADAADWPDEDESPEDIFQAAESVQQTFEAMRVTRGLDESSERLLRLAWRPDLSRELPTRCRALVPAAQRYLQVDEPILELSDRQALLEAPGLASRLRLLEKKLRALATH
jgi:ATP-dependent Lon protease